eukprot:TRINITY_DN3100_c0_g1_i1.p1 TRINITY_DN3100_c0_g1~~TRINITY_DN3100_c0_g1_i1.p1  ORF type:complete len:354 (-),score=-6.70 TRINITY_DN3100_c0_g1_i1:388-1449(-)
MILRSYFAVVVLILASVSTVLGFVRIETGPLNGTEFDSAQIYRKGDDFTAKWETITGKLVNHTSDDIEGNIVYLFRWSRTSFWQTVISLKDQGALAVLHLGENVVPGRHYCVYTGPTAEDIGILAWEVYFKEWADVQAMVDNGTEIIITIVSDGNPWSDVINSLGPMLVWRVVLGGATAAVMIFALYKLIVLVKYQGSHFNVPQVCLALEIIANIWRIFLFDVDPIGCYQELPTVFTIFINLISLPFGTATFVLITFYWHEIVSDSSITIHRFLHKLKVPFFVIFLTLILVSTILAILSYYFDFGATKPITIIYLCISGIFLAFYIVTAVQISKRMRAGEKMKRVRRLNRVST